MTNVEAAGETRVQVLVYLITKTRLFNYIENFNTKKN